METARTDSLRYSETRESIYRPKCSVPGHCPACGGYSFCYDFISKVNRAASFIPFVVGMVVGALLMAVMFDLFPKG